MRKGTTATASRHLRTLFAVGAAGMLTDGQLLERFANRDGDPAELAFAALVERHGSMVLRVARGILLDEHSAHDAFQATFLILARKARSLWVRDSLGPWLHGVAYRVASQARTLEIRTKKREKAAARPELVRSVDQDRADLIHAINEEIDRLPQPFRLAVVACHLEGLTQQDAADRLGWRIGTLQSRLARGREKLRDRLERRGLNPSLGVLAYHLAPAPHLLASTTARLAATLKLGPTITGMIPATVLALINTTMKGMLMTKLKLGAATVLMVLGGIVGTGMATGVGGLGQPIAQEPTTRPVVLPKIDEPATLDSEPSLSLPKKPTMPWETVVRVKVKVDDQKWEVGSGTVISSSKEESIILTAHHIFRLEGKPQPAPKDFKAPILVDLFNGQFVSQDPAQVGKAEQGIVGELIDYDFDSGLGLIRIRPGRRLPASQVVPPSWQAKKGMKMISVGCSLGADATAWDATIIDPLQKMHRDNKFIGYEMSCTGEPKEGRFGGGLYTTDGYVAGICNYADRFLHTGSYAIPDAIYELLEDNGIALQYAPEPPPESRSQAGPEPRNKPALDVDIHGFKFPPPADLLAAAGHQPGSPPNLEPAPLVPEAPKAKDKPTEPSLTEPSLPRPWETVVRVKIKTPGDPTLRFSSGVVIQSWPNSAYILTCAHNLGSPASDIHTRGLNYGPYGYSGQISVDLFDGELVGRSPGKVQCIARDVPTGLVCYDFTADLAVIRIETKTQLKVSPLVKAGWKPVAGMDMISVGCSEGNDATAWNTSVLDPQIPLTVNSGSTVVMSCEHLPKPGRSGGGLFTLDGRLVGICNYADPAAQSGLYATPLVIRKFLYDKGLRELSGPDDPDPSRTKVAVADPFLNSKLFKFTPGDRQIQGLLSGVIDPAPENDSNLALPLNPKPWETVVRIKIYHDANSPKVCSGTVIRSDENESIILTTWRDFHIDKGSTYEPPLINYRVPIKVDLFDGRLLGRNPAQVRVDESNLIGELVHSDAVAQLAVVRIRPGRTLPATSLVSPNKIPRAGLKLYSVGCSKGDFATAGNATILVPSYQATPSSPLGMILSQTEAEPARMGGGLSTIDGELIGVCLSPGLEGKTSLYVHPETIRDFLNGPRHRATMARQELPKGANSGWRRADTDPLVSPATAEQSRIDSLEKKLDQVLKSLEDLKAKPKPE